MGVSVLIHSRSVHSVLLFCGFGWKASMCTMGEVFTFRGKMCGETVYKDMISKVEGNEAKEGSLQRKRRIVIIALFF